MVDSCATAHATTHAAAHATAHTLQHTRYNTHATTHTLQHPPTTDLHMGGGEQDPLRRQLVEVRGGGLGDAVPEEVGG